MATQRKRSIELEVAELCAELAPAGRRLDPASILQEPRVMLGDLGLDSLACADVAVAVEERFGVRLADGDASVLTVADIVAGVHRGMADPRPRIPPGIGRAQPLVKLLAGWAFRWQTRLKVRGTDHVPKIGPAIVAANHRSMLDIPLLVTASPRPILFMGKRELFGDPFRRWALHEMGGFPVRREIADIRAIDVGLAILQRGDLLGVYPEGTRSRTGEMLPFLKGAAWLALRTGVPIVPCGIRGTERAQHRSFRKTARIRFGPAIAVEAEPDHRARRERAHTLIEQLLHAITDLLA